MIYCQQCGYNRPEREVIAGVCITCRADVVTDERPVSALLSSLFRRPKKRVTVSRSRHILTVKETT